MYSYFICIKIIIFILYSFIKLKWISKITPPPYLKYKKKYLTLKNYLDSNNLTGGSSQPNSPTLLINVNGTEIDLLSFNP